MIELGSIVRKELVFKETGRDSGSNTFQLG